MQCSSATRFHHLTTQKLSVLELPYYNMPLWKHCIYFQWIVAFHIIALVLEMAWCHWFLKWLDISFSSLCKAIWRHRNYKMPVRYILSSVWVRLSIFSQLSIIHYLGLCVFSLPISLVMIERIYIRCLIIIIKSEVWTTIHCLGLGHETMVCTVCLYILMASSHYLNPCWLVN